MRALSRHAFLATSAGFTSYLYLNRKRQIQNLCDPQEFTLKSHSVLNPKYDKRHKDGEDACLVRPNFVCALDGVGGWIEVLIDSGVMTKEFIKLVGSVYDSGKYSELDTILKESVKLIKAKGSTTCVMVELVNHVSGPKLKTLNFGDSGYMLFRADGSPDGFSTFAQSESQQHYFNCPYQLSLRTKFEKE